MSILTGIIIGIAVFFLIASCIPWFSKKSAEIAENKILSGILKMASEKAFGFPFLAKAYDEYFELNDLKEEYHLRHKRPPAPVKALKYRESAATKREILFRNRILKYQIEYYEYLFPWLADYKDVEIDDEAIQRYLTRLRTGFLKQNTNHFLMQRNFKLH
jgi:hypothetical protein